MLDFSVTFLITIINITVLFLVLRKILFRPVTKFMADRSKKVEDAILQAEKDRTQAKSLLARYEAQLDTAKDDADAILRETIEKAQQEADSIVAQGRASADAMLINARKQIEAEHQAALAVLRKEAAVLVVAAAGRMLSREIRDDDNVQFARMLLAEVSGSAEAASGTGARGL